MTARRRNPRSGGQAPSPDKAPSGRPEAAARLPLPPLRRPRPRGALLRRRDHARAARAAARDHQRLPRRQQLAQQRAAAPPLDDRAERHRHAQRRRRRAPPQRAPAPRAPRSPPWCRRAERWAGASTRDGWLADPAQPSGSWHGVLCRRSVPRYRKHRRPWLMIWFQTLRACCYAMDMGPRRRLLQRG